MAAEGGGDGQPVQGELSPGCPGLLQRGRRGGQVRGGGEFGAGQGSQEVLAGLGGDGGGEGGPPAGVRGDRRQGVTAGGEHGGPQPVGAEHDPRAQGAGWLVAAGWVAAGKLGGGDRPQQPVSGGAVWLADADGLEGGVGQP